MSVKFTDLWWLCVNFMAKCFLYAQLSGMLNMFRNIFAAFLFCMIHGLKRFTLTFWENCLSRLLNIEHYLGMVGSVA